MSATAPIVLAIDDEIQMRRLLRVTMESAGYRFYEAETGEKGLVEAVAKRPNVVVLDLGLPDIDGLEVLSRLREWSQVPVVVLSVREGEEDKIAALDAGADDYVTKPFNLGELLARLRVAQRHAQPEKPQTVFEHGPLKVDFEKRQVYVKNKLLELTPTEYKLLRLLIQSQGKVLTHRQILTTIWGPEHEDQALYLRVYVSNLRRKLSSRAPLQDLIKNEPGIGYRFAV